MNWKRNRYLMGWTWSVTSIIFGWLHNRCDMWKKENVNLTEMQWPYIFAIRREKDDTDRIFWKGLIFLFLFQPVAKYLFESLDSYVVTYKAMYVSTKNSVKLNPYSKLRSGVDLTPSSSFFLFSKDDLRSIKDELRSNFVQWELSLKSLF